MALTFIRTTEIIRAEWPEFDETAAEWRVPPERMKMRDPHIVPLSRQALDVAHAERNQVTAAYVHAEYLPERRRMMRHGAII